MAANSLTHKALEAYDMAMPVVSRTLQGCEGDLDTIQVCQLAEMFLIKAVQDAWCIEHGLKWDDVKNMSVLEIREKM